MSDAKQTEYEKLKKKLHQSILDKKNIDKELTQIEEDIYGKETLYLTNTYHHSYGNIIKGFDNFLKTGGQSAGHHSGLSSRRRTSFTDDDRIFSLSSAVYVKHLQRKNRDADDGAGNIGEQLDDMDDEDDEDQSASASMASSSSSSSSSSRKRKRDV
ncbi:Eaf6 protein [Saccharomycopsis crataegensis]|uniref:Chromatin modification-related protein EAF6 n=1 Tax=Saccharomycopsis crataegensis TaxID=43959 RepID=A0AAV5QV22_9ASCO|nr:Eaf6 protein [Saccharomycopsis crataegensis]